MRKSKILFFTLFFIFIIINMLVFVRSDYNSTVIETNSTLFYTCGNGICNTGDNCSGNSCFSGVGVEYESVIINVLNTSQWINVGIDLYSKNLTLVDNILSHIPTSEFNLSLKLDDSFYGSITKEGFNRIINNPQIKSIYRSGNAQIALQQNEERNNKINLWFIVILLLIISLIVICFIIFKRKKNR